MSIYSKLLVHVEKSYSGNKKIGLSKFWQIDKNSFLTADISTGSNRIEACMVSFESSRGDKKNECLIINVGGPSAELGTTKRLTKMPR